MASVLELHKNGKIEIRNRQPISNRKILSKVYTPGVAEVCKVIHKDKENAHKYTIKGNTVAIVTDGTAVLGLGDIGPEAALPVMEGKAAIFRQFAGINAFPICVDTKDVDEIVNLVKQISPTFGAVNLEDISAPRCFEIEEKLLKELDIPVFHDDQHGTAIVVLAALINSLKILKMKFSDIRIVISGAGAAGIAVAKLLLKMKPKDIILVDSKGIIYQGRKENMNKAKEQIAVLTNKDKQKGSLADAVKGNNVFIGVSRPGILTEEMVRTMNQPVIFALSNPVPEIMPDKALNAGARIVATGRSDFPNQINNALVFPGLFKGLLKTKLQLNDAIKLRAAKALASIIKNPKPSKIIPDIFNKKIVDAVASSVKRGVKNEI